MKAIVTKYLPCSAVLGSRIKATAEGGNRITIPYPHDAHDPHRVAAITLCQKMGWGMDIVGGGMPDQTGECFVFVGELMAALRAVEAVRADFQAGKRDGATMGAVSAAMDRVRETLVAL